MLSAILLVALAGQPSLVEDFDSIGGLIERGWMLRNNSNPTNPIYPTWFRGPLPANPHWFAQPRFSAPFAAHQGDYYLAANYRVCGGFSGAGTLSLWAVTPTVNLSNRSMTFWARRSTEPFFPDRLQIRWSPSWGDPGTTAEGVGDFSVLILDVPDVPSVWTSYTINFSGSRVSSRLGKIAFRYFVEDAGPDGTRSDYLGIDTLRIE